MSWHPQHGSSFEVARGPRAREVLAAAVEKHVDHEINYYSSLAEFTIQGSFVVHLKPRTLR